MSEYDYSLPDFRKFGNRLGHHVCQPEACRDKHELQADYSARYVGAIGSEISPCIDYQLTKSVAALCSRGLFALWLQSLLRCGACLLPSTKQ